MPAAARRERSRARTAPAIPAASRAPPTANTATSVGTSGTMTKPVPNVPTSAPAVAHADRRPTTAP